jgi:FkbM family methyltransferase
MLNVLDFIFYFLPNTIIRKIVKIVFWIRYGIKPRQKIHSVFEPEIREILNGDKVILFDIGGAKNLQPHHNKLIGNASFYVFEPDQRSLQELEATKERYLYPQDFVYIPKALAGSEGERTLYLTNEPTGSSILPLNRASKWFNPHSTYLFPMREVQIETFTLNSLIKDYELNGFHAIKLDVQGAEMEILRALDDVYFQSLLCIEMEVGLHDDAMIGQTTLTETLAFMKDKGFSLFDIRVNRSNGPLNFSNVNYAKDFFGADHPEHALAFQAVETDLVFFRDIQWVKNHISHSKPALLQKLIVLYGTYNFFCEAAELNDFLLSSGQTTTDAHEKSALSLKKWHQKQQLTCLDQKQILKKNRYQHWGQYMWVPFPSS